MVSYKTVEGGDLLPYELNINYFDALNPPGTGEPLALQVDRFVTAHAVLLSLVGMPGIYFHSLFGSRGWPEGATASGRHRTINRQKFERYEIEAALADEGSRQAQVFGRTSRLLKTRAEHAAFHPFGSQQVIPAADGVFALLRLSPDEGERVLCLQNISARAQPIPGGATNALGTSSPARDIITGQSIPLNESRLLEPYETLWLAAERKEF